MHNSLIESTQTEHEIWLEERRTGIGGSDIGAIIGEDEYCSAYDVYEEKMGIAEPVEDNKYMVAGRMLEEAVALYYQEETGKSYQKPHKMRVLHPEIDYFSASIDRVINYGGDVGILECKTTQRTLEEPLTKWFAQLQWYLYVTGYRWGAVAWLERGLEFKYFEYERNEDAISVLVEAAHNFWNNHVVPGIPPAPTTASDIKKMFPSHSSGKTIEAADSVFDTANRLAELKRLQEPVQQEIEQLSDRLKVLMCDAETLSFGKTVIATYKQAKPSSKFDEAEFRIQHPDIYERFIKSVPGSRRFLLKLK